MKKLTVLMLGMFLVVSAVAFSGCAKKSAPKAPVAVQKAVKTPAAVTAKKAVKAPAKKAVKTKKAATAVKVKS